MDRLKPLFIYKSQKQMRTDLTEEEKEAFEAEKAVLRLFVNAVGAFLFGAAFIYLCISAIIMHLAAAFGAAMTSATAASAAFGLFFGVVSDIGWVITALTVLSGIISGWCINRGWYWYKKL